MAGKKAKRCAVCRGKRPGGLMGMVNGKHKPLCPDCKRKNLAGRSSHLEAKERSEERKEALHLCGHLTEKSLPGGVVWRSPCGNMTRKAKCANHDRGAG